VLYGDRQLEVLTAWTPDMLTMFSFAMLQGDPKTAPGTAFRSSIVTENMAKGMVRNR
jgi:hypothetical protein